MKIQPQGSWNTVFRRVLTDLWTKSLEVVVRLARLNTEGKIGRSSRCRIPISMVTNETPFTTPSRTTAEGGAANRSRSTNAGSVSSKIQSRDKRHTVQLPLLSRTNNSLPSGDAVAESLFFRTSHVRSRRKRPETRARQSHCFAPATGKIGCGCGFRGAHR
jgi:hypothetical protein